MYEDWDEYEGWSQLDPVLKPYLQFSKIAWKMPTNSSSSGTAPDNRNREKEITVSFLKNDDKPFAFDNAPYNWYLKPYCNIYFFLTEVSSKTKDPSLFFRRFS